MRKKWHFMRIAWPEGGLPLPPVIGPPPGDAPVPAKNTDRDARRDALRRILTERAITNQDELVEALGAAGFQVTQSSISRDLRDLGAFKVDGAYRLPQLEVEGPPWLSSLQGFTAAGPNLLVVHTVTGAAPQVGLHFDRARWPEVVGTVAGDDTIFVAVRGLGARRRLESRLAGLARRERRDG